MNINDVKQEVAKMGPAEMGAEDVLEGHYAPQCQCQLDWGVW